MKEELKKININLEDIEENVNLFNNINEAVEKMRVATLEDRFEVVLNNNLIEAKDKYTGFRTILGCRISYDNLDKNVSFIVRIDTKPTYEELENQLQQKENIIKEVREKIRDIQDIECERSGAFNAFPEFIQINVEEFLDILDKKEVN